MAQFAPTTPTESEIIGRSRRDGNRLFKDWYDALGRADKAEEPAAYVFVMGSVA
ncbi:MAG TPA: hypothetical protein VLS53_07815 [Candidatus Dormibacteraeota bacterium]|nr:hypothetical protein [Candidatus Dormibacteraeota bacterium]